MKAKGGGSRQRQRKRDPKKKIPKRCTACQAVAMYLPKERTCKNCNVGWLVAIEEYEVKS